MLRKNLCGEWSAISPCVYGLPLLIGLSCLLSNCTEGCVVRAEDKSTNEPSPLDQLDSAKIPAWLRFPGQPKELVAVFSGHRGRINCLAFSPNGKYLASGGMDGTIRLWDTAGVRDPRVIDVKSPVHALAFAPDSKALASTHFDDTLRLWGISGDEPKERATVREVGVMFLVGFSPDGNTLATPGRPGSVGGKPGPMPGGTAAVLLWDVTGMQLKLGAQLGRSRMPFGRVVFAPDGKTVACIEADPEGKGWLPVGVITLWDTTTRKERATVGGFKSMVTSVSFAPDAKTLAVALEFEGDIRLYDLTGSKPKEKTALQGHDDGAAVSFVGFAPDGKTLVSSGMIDGRIIIWDAVNGAKLHEVRMPGKGPVSCAFAPDGRHLAAIYRDGMIYILRLR